MKHLRRSLSNLNGYLLVTCFFCMIFGAACGVKKKEVTTDQNPVASSEIPQGVNSTKNHKFLIRPSSDKLAVDEEYKISYFVVTDGLVYPGAETSLDVEYRMPSMPGMGTANMPLSPSAPGRFDAVYNISMGGDWEIKILFRQNGAVIDEITYTFMVPE